MERRTRQVEVLETKRIKMQKAFDEETFNRREERTQLFGHPSVADWKQNDDESIAVDPRSFSVRELQVQQKQMLEGGVVT